MSIPSANNSIIVLPGEFAVVDYKKSKSWLKATIGTSCTVLTLFNQQRQISVMVHIHNYTVVEEKFEEIARVLRSQCDTSLETLTFKAKVVAESTDLFSSIQQEAVITLLGRIGVKWEKVNLEPELSQIQMNTSTGELTFLQ